MNTRALCLFFPLMALACGGGVAGANSASGIAAVASDVPVTTMLARTINLANALEAPREGDWGLRLESAHFHAIRAAGFSAVRVPIQWSAHAAASAPYAVDPSFFARIDWVVREAKTGGLAVILDFQNYDALTKELGPHRARFLAIWEQIATHYAKEDSRVLFEPYNEPHTLLDASTWNTLARETLAIIRKSNPTRWVVIGPTGWNGWPQVPTLELPDQDRRIVAAFHFYEPMEFTHQGAEWMEGSAAWQGRAWNGTPEEIAELRKAFDAVATWAKTHDRPVFIGEFGVIDKAPNTSRARWLRAVTCEARARHFAWGLWDFATNFGAYERQRNEWRREVLDAVSDPPTGCVR